MARVLTRLVARAHGASLAGAARRFAAAAADPAEAQRRRLLGLLPDLAAGAYGREHGLGGVGSVRAFRQRVPVSDAASMEPWWARVAQGEPGVVTRAPVLMMERSGGSSGRTRLVPFTQPLLDEIGEATGPWMRDLYRAFPGLARGRHYWAVSPVAQGPRATAGGVPVGFDDDTGYFGPLARLGLRVLMAVPPEVVRLDRMDAWRRATLRHLAAADDLALLSAWSPTFLTLLLDALERDLDAVLGDAPASRARRVREALARGEPLGHALWPRLALVSCWTDGASARFLPALRRHLPRAPLQGKGLLATEGVVSFPLAPAPAPVLAVGSHFLEFLDLGRPGTPPLLAHELRPGGRYSPLLTTGGGLVRYHLKDVVTCVGLHGALPCVRFEGRLDRVADLCGEKVAEGQAEEALAYACSKTGLAPRFALLAPSLGGAGGRPRYRLFLETHAPRAHLEQAARLVDEALAEAHPYRYARELGQLAPVEAVRVREGAEAHRRVLLARGARLGGLKPSAFDPRPAWDEAFEEAPP